MNNKISVTNHSDIANRKNRKPRQSQEEILSKALGSHVSKWIYDNYSDVCESYCICGKNIKNRHRVRNADKTAFVGSECIQYFSDELQRDVLKAKENTDIPLTGTERKLKKKIQEEKLDYYIGEIDSLLRNPCFNGLCPSGVSFKRDLRSLKKSVQILLDKIEQNKARI
jgi:hypothetical protein